MMLNNGTWYIYVNSAHSVILYNGTIYIQLMYSKPCEILYIFNIFLYVLCTLYINTEYGLSTQWET